MKLESERLYLRPICIEDARDILNATKDEEIRYMTGTKTKFTLEQIRAHIERINEDTTRYDFAICLKSTDKMIGELSILDIIEEDRKAGFRISMNSIALTGNGYGTEAIKRIIHFVFKELGLNRLQLEVFSHNPRGIRVYEKVGFKKEGVLRQALYYNGTYSDEIIMGMLKSDFEIIPS
ncbi:GNAT family N-acetyltransferase [Rummeliibacillus pycnus]|uniref:GNAT family N-acetyltransferase n=1 Tax=Rummeliibacillus pycnus TaxID=101070 RepID=UPI003D2ADC4A